MQGGDAVWGNTTHAPDDECDGKHSHGELIAFRHSRQLGAEQNEKDMTGNMTVDQAGTWILEHTPSTFQVRHLVVG